MNLNYGPEYKNFKKEVITFCKKWEGVHFVDEAKLPLTPITKVGGKKITRTEWQSILIDEGYFARSIPQRIWWLWWRKRRY